MSARETVARDEEEGAEEEEGRKERVAGSARVACVGSTYGRFVASCACRINSMHVRSGSQREDESITCSRVIVAIYNKFYHVKCKSIKRPSMRERMK